MIADIFVHRYRSYALGQAQDGALLSWTAGKPHPELDEAHTAPTTGKPQMNTDDLGLHIPPGMSLPGSTRQSMSRVKPLDRRVKPGDDSVE